MPSFEEMFAKSRGRPILHQGRTLSLVDEFPAEGAKTLRVTFESCNSEWRQGVAIGFSGSVKVNGHVLRKGIVLWHDTAPHAIDLQLIGDVHNIEIRNVWDLGDGVMQSGHNGAAMIVVPVDQGRKYECNDGKADDDFDDLVFRIERTS